MKYFRFKMQARFEHEHRIARLGPEEKMDGIERMKKMKEERKMLHKKLPAPMTESQEREVWENEDDMNKTEFSFESFFRLHDRDQSGKLNREEV